MTAAEKYAELEAQGLERPVCECHGKPKTWSAESARPRGGRWQCRVERRHRRKNTPGTYEFNYKNGIGLPGFIERMADSRRRRLAANVKDAAVLTELQATYPDIWEAIVSG